MHPSNQPTFDFERIERRNRTIDAITAAPLTGGQTTAQNQKLVLIALYQLGDEFGRPCWPSIPTISERTQLSPRTVQRAIADLLRRNLIAVQLQKNPAGKVSNVYGLNLNSLTIDSATSAPRSPTATRSTRSPANVSDHAVERYANCGSDTPTVAAIRHYWRPNKDPDPRSSQPPPPPTPSKEAAAAAEILTLEGIGQANQTAAAALDRGMTVLQIVDAVATAKKHRRSFQNWRAALVARLRTGDWPAELRAVHPRIPAGSRAAESEEPAEVPAVPLGQQLRQLLERQANDRKTQQD